MHLQGTVNKSAVAQAVLATYSWLCRNSNTKLEDALSSDNDDPIEAFLSFIGDCLGHDSPELRLHRVLCEKYGLPELGTTRAAYISKTAVIKLYTNGHGIAASMYESRFGTTDRLPVARTRSISIDGVDLLFMEKVEVATLEEVCERLGYIPQFVYSIDCCQVGFTRKGNLVAYDYA